MPLFSIRHASLLCPSHFSRALGHSRQRFSPKFFSLPRPPSDSNHASTQRSFYEVRIEDPTFISICSHSLSLPLDFCLPSCLHLIPAMLPIVGVCTRYEPRIPPPSVSTRAQRSCFGARISSWGAWDNAGSDSFDVDFSSSCRFFWE